MSSATERLIEAIRAEVDHAFANGHVLSGDCQGVAPGEQVPAVRADLLLAILDSPEVNESR